MADAVFSENLGDLSRQRTGRQALVAELFNQALGHNRAAIAQRESQRNRRLNTLLTIAEIMQRRRGQELGSQLEAERSRQYGQLQREGMQSRERIGLAELVQAAQRQQAAQQQRQAETAQATQEGNRALGISLLQKGIPASVTQGGLPQTPESQRLLGDISARLRDQEAQQNMRRQTIAEGVQARAARLNNLQGKLEALVANDDVSNKEFIKLRDQAFTESGVPMPANVPNIQRGGKSQLLSIVPAMKEAYFKSLKNIPPDEVFIDPDTLEATAIESNLYQDDSKPWVDGGVPESQEQLDSLPSGSQYRLEPGGQIWVVP